MRHTLPPHGLRAPPHVTLPLPNAAAVVGEPLVRLHGDRSLAEAVVLPRGLTAHGREPQRGHRLANGTVVVGAHEHVQIRHLAHVGRGVEPPKLPSLEPHAREAGCSQGRQHALALALLVDLLGEGGVVGRLQLAAHGRGHVQRGKRREQDPAAPHDGRHLGRVEFVRAVGRGADPHGVHEQAEHVGQFLGEHG